MVRILSLSLLPIALFACKGGGSDTTDTTDIDAPPLQQIWINEFMASNQGSYPVGDLTPDWIELYNPAAEAVDLEGWMISDDSATPDKHVFFESLAVPAGGFLVILASGDVLLGPEHTGFKLSAAGEEIVVTDPWDRTVDWVEFGAQAVDTSTARVVDGDPESGWAQVAGGTPGASNNQ